VAQSLVVQFTEFQRRRDRERDRGRVDHRPPASRRHEDALRLGLDLGDARVEALAGRELILALLPARIHRPKTAHQDPASVSSMSSPDQ
jgi:hypothetical protein